MTFGGQASKNVQDVQTLAFETFMCVLSVLACLDVFYIFILGKISWKVLNMLRFIFRLKNVCVGLPKVHARSPQGGPSRHCLGTVNRRAKGRCGVH